MIAKRQTLWMPPETTWARCPRCKARRGQPCIAKNGGECPNPHHARVTRLIALQSRLWCRGCLKRGNPCVPLVSAYPCNAGHLHFYCERCLEDGSAYGFVSLTEAYALEIQCVRGDHAEFRRRMDAEIAMKVLRQQQ